MDYSQTIAYLYSSLPVFHRNGPSAYNNSLDKTLLLCAALGNPQGKFKSVHIAGTNGKGSTSHMTAAILQAAGYKTGLFTSPHLKDFTERIKINGEEIAKQEVVDFVSANKELLEEIKPSFFEMNAALAFAHFAAHEVDVAVIETGLGGRLDSTNIIMPDACLITNISYDHQHILGNTLQQIAAEKAGIIKENTPVVIGHRGKETAEIFQNKAKEKNASLFFAEDRYQVSAYRMENGKLFLDIASDCGYQELECGLGGIYQLENITAVIALTDLLIARGYIISEEHLRKGLADVVPLTGLKGRWQILGKDPLIIADTGHNEAGIKAVFSQISSMKYKKLHVVFGMVSDKEPDQVLQYLPKDAVYYFCRANIPRSMDAFVLAGKAAGYGLQGTVVEDVQVALQKAKEEAKAGDLIFVGGSTFVVAEAL